MRAIFRTRDGLQSTIRKVMDCDPDCDIIVRALEPRPPKPIVEELGRPTTRFSETRQYRRTEEEWMGVPIFEEI